MPSKNKPLTDAELDVYEAGRDLAADILQSIAEMKAGQVKPVDTSGRTDLFPDSWPEAS